MRWKEAGNARGRGEARRAVARKRGGFKISGEIFGDEAREGELERAGAGESWWRRRAVGGGLRLKGAAGVLMRVSAR